jgi:hypothetical protein
MVQMEHPKAKNEFPEQVRTRIEEARRKQKKPSDTLAGHDNDCEQELETVTTPAAAIAFPEFPTLNLTILKGVIGDRAQDQPYSPASLTPTIAIA